MPQYNLNINSRTYTVDVDSDKPILWILRDDINLTGTKYGCGIGQCGTCTIHLDSAPVRSCSIPVSAVGDLKIMTIEGYVGNDIHDKIVELWQEFNVPQCGYCQAGQIMTALALLRQNNAPSDQEIDSSLHGNICRCGTYYRIKKAIRQFEHR